jgi:hypothetical protein
MRRAPRFTPRLLERGLWATYDTTMARVYKLHGNSHASAKHMARWLNTCHKPQSCFCANCDTQHPANRT